MVQHPPEYRKQKHQINGAFFLHQIKIIENESKAALLLLSYLFEIVDKKQTNYLWSKVYAHSS